MTRSSETVEHLTRFLGRLADKHSGPDLVFSLRLAEAGLHALGRRDAPAPAIAVIGPTQTGKSTVVNVLAGGGYVAASPLAAHTQRASVLAVNTEADNPALRLATGPLQATPIPVESDCPPCLIWDTPDFDSNASAVYRQQVARVCAVADLVVVVLSKEKYADQSVWTVLEAIAPLGVPTVVCLNKCEDGPGPRGTGGHGDGRSDADILVPAIRRRLEGSPAPGAGTPVLVLPRVAAGDPVSLLRRPDVQGFRRSVFEHLASRSAASRRAGLNCLIQRHWSAWVAPVEEELACHRNWALLLEARTRSFLARYRSEYIDNTRHHDVAHKAILGLLELLEIPALAGPLSRTRRVLTWPFRKLYSAFGSPGEPTLDQELKVLEAALDHYLLSLRSEALEQRHPWWCALADELPGIEPQLRRDFQEAVDRYRHEFQPRIDQLSEDLYRKLERNPLTLNTLRATRIGADAGGILLAVKTGTLGVYDALFAPAVVSVTSYLAESAVGQYLRSVIGRLKEEQFEQISAIIRETLETPLNELQPRGAGLFGVSAEDLAAAARQAGELGS